MMRRPVSASERDFESVPVCSMLRVEALRSERLILFMTQTIGGNSANEIRESCQLFQTITTNIAINVRISRPIASTPRVIALRSRVVSYRNLEIMSDECTAF